MASLFAASWAIAPRTKRVWLVHMELAFVCDWQETSHGWKLNLELKNPSDRLRHDDSVTKTFRLVLRSSVEEL